MVIISLFISISVFVCLKSVPILIEIYDLYGCMLLFGIGCTIGSIFILFVLDETSGIDIGSNVQIDNNNASINLDRRPLIPIQYQRRNYHTFNKHRNDQHL